MSLPEHQQDVERLRYLIDIQRSYLTSERLQEQARKDALTFQQQRVAKAESELEVLEGRLRETLANPLPQETVSTLEEIRARASRHVGSTSDIPVLLRIIDRLVGQR